MNSEQRWEGRCTSNGSGPSYRKAQHLTICSRPPKLIHDPSRAQSMNINQRAIALQVEVERQLPDFVQLVRNQQGEIVLHQDAFAADYQDHEFVLLGKAIKYAGIFGREVKVVGKNRDTLNDANEG
jgi:hypothetical protein